ncbi:quinone oxidoreductase [Sorangium cellulosum]|uniref:Quinone oxidoreductase n=1 Tax=Sorangium cellulosum TaxID=56 RepID=A0A4P2Q161_SORCE|nr:quinone oxidoreductase [Sorangium cellulosum]AUX22646.1 quinone oxidoreductase [Sorangium cellulosum]
MRAIRPKAAGGPEVMQLEELPTPAPGPGEAVIRVEAAGVNFIDTYQRSGQYRTEVPIPLGLEGAGRVEAVGPGVAEVKEGDEVAWAAGPGSYATHVRIPVAKLVPVPAGVGARNAAAAMLQGLTAHYLVRSTFPLGPSHTCLVHAAAGGVGLLLCQMAKRLGARVIGTASTDAKARLAREAGADEVILYTQADFEAEARRLTGGEGVHVVYDGVGKDTFAKSLGALRTRGMLVLFGQASGPVPSFDPQILNQKGSLFLTRPSLGHYTATREELLGRAADVLGAIARGELTISVGATYPLAEAAEAHRALQGRATTGKVLLIP